MLDILVHTFNPSAPEAWEENCKVKDSESYKGTLQGFVLVSPKRRREKKKEENIRGSLRDRKC